MKHIAYLFDTKQTLLAKGSMIIPSSDFKVSVMTLNFEDQGSVNYKVEGSIESDGDVMAWTVHDKSPSSCDIYF